MTVLREIVGLAVVMVGTAAIAVLTYAIAGYVDHWERTRRLAREHAAFQREHGHGRLAFNQSMHSRVVGQYTAQDGHWYVVASSPAEAVDSLIELARDRGTLS